MNLTGNAGTILRAATLCALLLSSLGAYAQPAPDMNEVLVENRWAKVTRGDFEIELLRLPADVRGGFAFSSKRVIDLLVRMLVSKSLAVQARAGDLYKDPQMQQRRTLEIDKVDASMLIAKTEEEAGKTFDANLAKSDARIRELYLVDSSRFRVPEQISASHILFDLKTHSKEEALKLAQDAKAKIAAGADFNTLAKQISDDPTARQNGGHLGFFDATQMDPEFTQAAFALKAPGDVSAPVLSSFGYHIIRLDDRHPARTKSYQEVKPEIVAEERRKYIDGQRELLIGEVRDDPMSRINQAAVDAMVPKVDPEIMNRANQMFKK